MKYQKVKTHILNNLFIYCQSMILSKAISYQIENDVRIAATYVRRDNVDIQNMSTLIIIKSIQQKVILHCHHQYISINLLITYYQDMNHKNKRFSIQYDRILNLNLTYSV